MPALSMTRLKLKSAGLLPKFIIENETAVKQLKTAKGFICGKTLAEPSLGMWTTTLWDSEENMRNYYTSGAHRELMPKLSQYASEAVLHIFLMIRRNYLLGRLCMNSLALKVGSVLHLKSRAKTI